jgi:hypothetical protein
MLRPEEAKFILGLPKACKPQAPLHKNIYDRRKSNAHAAIRFAKPKTMTVMVRHLKQKSGCRGIRFWSFNF